jgi:hypothetical protein
MPTKCIALQPRLPRPLGAPSNTHGLVGSARPPKDSVFTIAMSVERPTHVRSISDDINRITTQEHSPATFQVAGALSTEKISWPVTDCDTLIPMASRVVATRWTAKAQHKA